MYVSVESIWGDDVYMVSLIVFYIHACFDGIIARGKVMLLMRILQKQFGNRVSSLIDVSYREWWG
jgi:hypothetical protein